MMALRPGTPHHRDIPGHDEYAMWDAAYVLGSLSSAEWREFEEQMADCPSCRSAVGELSGIPALLSKLDRDDLAAIDLAFDHADSGLTAPLPPRGLLPSLLGKVRWRQRRSRTLTWTTGAAAAAVLAIGVLVGVAGNYPTSVSTPPQASVSVQPMTQVGTNRLASTISLSSQLWGTFISMNCVCLASPDAYHDTLAMVVVALMGVPPAVADS